jgi:hypothetical protein
MDTIPQPDPERQGRPARWLYCGRWMRRELKPGNELPHFSTRPAMRAHMPKVAAKPRTGLSLSCCIGSLLRSSAARMPAVAAEARAGAFGLTNRWVERGRRQRGPWAGAGEKGAWGLGPQLYLFCTNNYKLDGPGTSAFVGCERNLK